jgi:hypothetical protein
VNQKEVRQLVAYVRGCEGWAVVGSGPYRFHAPDGALIHLHGTVNSRTLANRRALLERHGLPKRRAHGKRS